MGASGFPAWFTGQEVTNYMMSLDKAKALIDACLDFDQKGNNPLLRLLTLDDSDKRLSTAYLYAFRRLMLVPDYENVMKTVDALLRIGMPVTSLVKSWLVDAPKIITQFPKDGTIRAFREITNKGYVYALSYLLDETQPKKDSKLVETYCLFQLLMPISEESIVAHLWPLLGQETDTDYFRKIGNLSMYPSPVTWLMEQVFIKGFSAQAENLADNPDGLEIELQDTLLDVVNHLAPVDVNRARDALFVVAQQSGQISGDVIDEIFANWREISPTIENFPETQTEMISAITVLDKDTTFMGKLTQEQATTLIERFDTLNTEKVKAFRQARIKPLKPGQVRRPERPIVRLIPDMGASRRLLAQAYGLLEINKEEEQ